MRSFLPYVAGDAAVGGEGEPTGMAEQFFVLMRDDPGQQRKGLIWDERLARAAQWHCEDMAAKRYFSHQTPDGVWPNDMVRAQGYRLPDYYPAAANNVESIALNYATAALAWLGLLGSPVHRRHLLGLTPFFCDQVMVGIGYLAAGAPYPVYWAIESAPLEETGDRK